MRVKQDQIFFQFCRSLKPQDVGIKSPFVFIQLHLIEPDGYSRALLTSELETIFAQAPLAPNSVAHPHVREAHARATGKAPTTSLPEDAGTNKRIPGPDDDCPICYDGMHGVAEASLVFCEECGNALHKECFQQC